MDSQEKSILAQEIGTGTPPSPPPANDFDCKCAGLECVAEDPNRPNFTKEIVLLKGNVTKFQYPGFQCQLESLQAVVDLVQAKGDPSRSIVFYNNNAIEVILDHTIQHRPQDVATYLFRYSDQFKRWKGVLGQDLSQKGFVDFLRSTPPDEVMEYEALLANVQNLQFCTEILGDFKYDDRNNFTVMFKVKEKEDAVKLPRTVEIYVPIYHEDEKRYFIDLELELHQPRREGERIAFILSCAKLEQYLRAARERQVKRLREKLDGYLILAGSKG